MNETDIAVKLAEHTEQIKVANHRISDLEEKTTTIETLALSVQKLAISVEALTKNQIEDRQKHNEMVKKLADIENTPTKEKSKKYDDAITYIAHILISAVVGAVLCYYGLK